MVPSREDGATLIVRFGGAAGGWLTHVPQGQMVIEGGLEGCQDQQTSP